MFISRTNTDSERPWTPLDLGAGSIVWSITRIRGYLWGTDFPLFSDHKALESPDKIAEHNPRAQRWLEFLTAYNYTLQYRKGSAKGERRFYPARLCLRRSSTSAVPAALIRPTKNVSSSSARTDYFLAHLAPCVSLWVG